MKYWVVLVQWMVLVTAMAAPAKAPPKQPAPAGNRFLFILETSAAMNRLEHGGRQAIFDLIYSGVDGRMRKGDTYGVWTFNDQVYAGVYPMQIWDAQKHLEQAAAAGRFLKSQKYQREGNATNLMNQLQAVLRVAKDLNIFVVTDGNTALSGTAFDEQINASYRTHGVQVRHTGKPLLTTLTVRNGVFTGGCVTVAGEKIVLAGLPPQTNDAVVVATLPTATATNSAGSAPKPAIGRVITPSEFETVASKPTNATPLVTKAEKRIIKYERLPPAEQTNLVLVITNPVPATNIVEPPPILVTPPVNATPSNIAETVTATNTPAVVSTPVPVVTDGPAPPTAPEPLPAIVPAQIQVSARTTGDPSTTTTSAFRGNLMLILGGVFVGASVVSAFMFLRRLRGAKQPSFISQGMDRK